MFFATRKSALLLLIPLLTQCAPKSAPPTQTVTGPFDSRGNYIEDWVNEPDKWYRPPAPNNHTKKPNPFLAKQQTQPKPAPVKIVQVDPKPSVVAKPKPKPVVKPKPRVITHTVRRGDTLSGLARRYGSSISKIKSANRISGSVIRIGQTLRIPK